MKFVAIRMPIISVPEIRGAKNPQTGHNARRNIRYDTIVTTAIVGITFGQYTPQADESDSPFTFGR
jgi:hypothetical protein